MVNFLKIPFTCASQTALVMWPATKFFTGAKPLEAAIRSAYHFPACFIRQWNLADMKENDSYDTYSKAASGAVAGIIKYTTRDGLTIKSTALGGFNNLAYHMAPEIYKKFFNGTDPGVYQLGFTTTVEAAENLLSVTAFGGPGTVTQAVSNGFALSILLNAFGCLQDTVESALATIIPIDYNDIETMVYGTNTKVEANDEL